MRLRPCAREKELAEQMELGSWPQASAAELRAHVEACPHCSDLVRVTQAMRAARAATGPAARLGSPGVLWWRAQLRRRRTAMQTIERPMLAAQIFAVVFSLGAAAFFLEPKAALGLGWLRWLEDLPGALHLVVLLPVGMQATPAAGWVAGIAVLAVLACGAAAIAGLEKR
jgi:type IV secretory pathway VirB2 component (pilin)